MDKKGAVELLYNYINKTDEKKINAGINYGNFLKNNTEFKKIVGKGKLSDFIKENSDKFYFKHDEKAGGKGWICIHIDRDNHNDNHYNYHNDKTIEIELMKYLININNNDYYENDYDNKQILKIIFNEIMNKKII